MNKPFNRNMLMIKLYCLSIFLIFEVKSNLILVLTSERNGDNYIGYGLLTGPDINDAVSCTTEDGPIEISQVNDTAFGTCIKYELLNSSNWVNTNSFKIFIEPILDQRWESFPIYTNKDNYSLPYDEYLNLPLSIWSKSNYNISFFSNSNDVIINLLIYEDKLFINDVNDCREKIKFIYKTWNHFVIKIKDYKFIIIYNGRSYIIFKNFTTWPKSFQIFSDTEVFWKVHKDEYLASKNSVLQRYGEIITYNKFLKLLILGPTNSQFDIKLFDSNESQRENPLIEENTTFAKFKWEHVFIPLNNQCIKYNLYTHLLKKNNSENVYLNNIWNCESNDSRVIQFNMPINKTNNLKCELLNNKTHYVENQNISNSCKNDEYFEDDCKTKEKYMSFFGEYPKICNTEGCFCQTGYEGEVCEKACTGNTWGLNCKQECGKCQSQCNRKNGTCQRCQDGYYGQKCRDKFTLNITVYSMNSTHVWFRWKISIERNISFHIQYKTNETILPLKCNLWREYNDYYCTVVENLQQNNMHSFKLLGKFEDKHFDIKQINVSSTISKSSIPQNLTVSVNLTKVVLKWMHPNITNGPLNKFVVNASIMESALNFKNNSIEEIPIIMNETRKYKHEINLEFATSYNITVYGDNGKKGEKSFLEVHITPPVPKILNHTFKCDTYNCNITIYATSTINNSSIYLVSSNAEKKSNLDDIFIDEIKEILKKNINTAKISVLEMKKFNETNSITFITPNEEKIFLYYCIIKNSFKKFTNSSYYIIRKKNSINVTQSLFYIYPILIGFIVVAPIICFLCYKKHYIIKKDEERISSLRQKEEQFEEQTILIKHVQKVSDQKYVKIRNLKDHILEMTEGEQNSNLLNKEFKMIPKNYDDLPCLESSTDMNKKKNRYVDLQTYDHSRVILNRVDKLDSDYINANYIDSYTSKKTFIATQGPLSLTVNDFWEMVWQENVKYIIMVVNEIENGKGKCFKYWTDPKFVKVFGNFTIENIETKKFVHYMIRKILVTHNNIQRIVIQYQFTSWPDHGVPLYCNIFIPFLKEVLKIQPKDFPILVHCSAGIGRTGTLIYCYNILEMAAAEKKINFISILQNLRRQRPKLVDNYNQYLFAHLVIYEYLLGKKYLISVNNSFEESLKKISSKDVFDYLMENRWQIEVMHNNIVPSIFNENKNRLQNMRPAYSMIYLSAYPFNNPDSMYINAEFVDCFLHPKRYITTQQPLSSTISDFWRLIDEYSVHTIINLNEIDKKDPTSCIFWPDANQKLMPEDYIEISRSNYSDRTIKKFVLRNLRADTSQEVTLIQLTGWSSKSPVPNNMKILNIWKKRLNKTSKRPIVIMCNDGLTGCGLFVAMSFLLEQIKLEQVCDVPLAVKAVRHAHIDFVTKQEQIDFLYKTASEYVKGFALYSNFNSK